MLTTIDIDPRTNVPREKLREINAFAAPWDDNDDHPIAIRVPAEATNIARRVFATIEIAPVWEGTTARITPEEYELFAEAANIAHNVGVPLQAFILPKSAWRRLTKAYWETDIATCREITT